MLQAASKGSPMPRPSRIILWVYIAFNLLIAVTLMVSPAQVDATYRGGAMTGTREFQWFSIGSLYLTFGVVAGSAGFSLEGGERSSSKSVFHVSGELIARATSASVMPWNFFISRSITSGR